MADHMATEFREAVCLIDKDSDGEIRVEEVASVMNWEEIEVADHLTLHFQHFLDTIMRYRETKDDAAEELKEAFQVFDSDQDGFISATELRNVMLNLGEKISDEEAEEMIKEADFDGDGLVSFQEFARMMMP